MTLSTRRAGFWALAIGAIIVGFFASVSVMRGLSMAYEYYADRQFSVYIKIDPALAIPLFIVCMVVLIFAICKTRDPSSEANPLHNYTAPPWRKVDFMLVIVAVITVFACFLYMWRSDAYVYMIFFLSLGSYLLAIALLIEATIRLREKTLISTCYWISFFKTYTMAKPPGLVMSLLLLINFGIVLVVVAQDSSIFSDYIPLGYPDYFSVPLLLLAAMLFVGLTFLCQFILQLSSRYEKANEEKIRSERLKSELITNVSHDLRTPLTSIVSYVDLLKGLPIKDEKFVEYTDVLSKKSARLTTLTADLMEASKASTGNLAVNMQELDLTEMVGQIAGEFDDRFAANDLNLVVDQPDLPVAVRADSRHLWRVLENLFGNIAKYAMPGTRVFVEFSYAESSVIFSAKNTSKTPLNYKCDDLLEQFARGDQARSSEGSGLGLHIAKSLVELMGGSFSAHATGDLFEARVRLIKAQ